MYLKTAIRYAKEGQKFRRKAWSQGHWIEYTSKEAPLKTIHGTPAALTVEDSLAADWLPVRVTTVQGAGTRMFHAGGKSYKKIGRRYYQLQPIATPAMESQVQI